LQARHENERTAGEKGYTRRAPFNQIPQEPLDFKLTKESNMRRRRRRSVSNPPCPSPAADKARPVATSSHPSRAWEKAWGGNYRGETGRGRQDGVWWEAKLTPRTRTEWGYMSKAMTDSGGKLLQP